MKRKERSATRSEWNAYVAWSNTQHNAARVVTEVDRTPVVIEYTTRDDAHSEQHNITENV